MPRERTLVVLGSGEVEEFILGHYRVHVEPVGLGDFVWSVTPIQDVSA